MIKLTRKDGECMHPGPAGLRSQELRPESLRPEPLRPDNSDCMWRLETLGLVTEGVVHDFNNVLATITGFAELILDTQTAPEGKRSRVDDFARNILLAAATGQATVRELRSFTRPSANAKEPLDLHEVLRQSLSMTRGALGGAVTFITDFQPGAAGMEGCRWQLHNVFINLFFNARDAMPRGGEITVKTSRLEGVSGLPDFAVVSVRDRGLGMTEETRSRLFEAKYSTKGGTGTGMGLANVAATVKDHGGMIMVDSAPGQGSEFRLHFPLLNSRRG